jgi:hypothetical protein
VYRDPSRFNRVSTCLLIDSAPHQHDSALFSRCAGAARHPRNYAASRSISLWSSLDRPKTSSSHDPESRQRTCTPRATHNLQTLLDQQRYSLPAPCREFCELFRMIFESALPAHTRRRHACPPSHIFGYACLLSPVLTLILTLRTL